MENQQLWQILVFLLSDPLILLLVLFFVGALIWLVLATLYDLAPGFMKKPILDLFFAPKEELEERAGFYSGRAEAEIRAEYDWLSRIGVVIFFGGVLALFAALGLLEFGYIEKDGVFIIGAFIWIISSLPIGGGIFIFLDYKTRYRAIDIMQRRIDIMQRREAKEAAYLKMAWGKDRSWTSQLDYVPGNNQRGTNNEQVPNKYTARPDYGSCCNYGDRTNYHSNKPNAQFE